MTKQNKPTRYPCQCKKKCGDDPEVLAGKLAGCSGHQNRKVKEFNENRKHSYNLLNIQEDKQ